MEITIIEDMKKVFNCLLDGVNYNDDNSIQAIFLLCDTYIRVCSEEDSIEFIAYVKDRLNRKKDEMLALSTDFDDYILKLDNYIDTPNL